MPAATALRFGTMPPAPKVHHETRLSQLLQKALKAKTEELQAQALTDADRRLTYSYRMLAKDAGIDASYPSKIVHGKGVPSIQVLEAIARALDPHFPLDDALMAAGYMPKSHDLRALVRRLTLYPREQVAAFDRMLRKTYDQVVILSDDENLYTFLDDEGNPQPPGRKRR